VSSAGTKPTREESAFGLNRTEEAVNDGYLKSDWIQREISRGSCKLKVPGGLHVYQSVNGDPDILHC